MLDSLLKCGYTTTEIETACINVRNDTRSGLMSQIERQAVRSEGMVEDRFSSAIDSATRQHYLTIPCRIAFPTAPSLPSSRKTTMLSKAPLQRRVSLSKNAPAIPCRTTSPPTTSPCMGKILPMSPPPPPLMRVGSPSLSPNARAERPFQIQGQHKSCFERHQ